MVFSIMFQKTGLSKMYLKSIWKILRIFKKKALLLDHNLITVILIAMLTAILRVFKGVILVLI